MEEKTAKSVALATFLRSKLLSLIGQPSFASSLAATALWPAWGLS